MKKYIKWLAPSALLFMAQITHAAPLIPTGTDLTGLINNIFAILNTLVYLLIGAAVVVFLWGVFLFIAKSSSGDSDGRKEAKNFMVFGIIGIAVMISVWGLVKFVTYSITGGTGVDVPRFNANGVTGGDSSQDTFNELFPN